MKNWQKTRNYRRMKDENGNAIANVINVFGRTVYHVCAYGRARTVHHVGSTTRQSVFPR